MFLCSAFGQLTSVSPDYCAASRPASHVFHDRKCPLWPLHCCGSQEDAASQQNSPLNATDIMLVILTCEHASSCPIFSDFLDVSRRNWFSFGLIKSWLFLFVCLFFRCFHLVSSQPQNSSLAWCSMLSMKKLSKNEEKIKCCSNTFCSKY